MFTDFNQLLTGMGAWMTTFGLKIGLVLLLALILLKVIRLSIDRAFLKIEHHHREETFVHMKNLKQFLYNATGGILLLVALLLSLNIAGFPITSESVLETPIGRWIFTRGLKILVVITLAFLSSKAGDLMLSYGFARLEKTKDGEMIKRTHTLKSVILNALNVLFFCIAGLMILDTLEIDVKPILATAGVLGVAVGFGSQQLIRDIINGFFILLDDQIRVGDVVEIAGKSGLVENVNLRITTLRDIAGNVHYVRNGDITVVTNMTKEWSRYVFEIGVAYRENVDEVIAVLRQVDVDLRQDPKFGPDILEPLEILGLDKFADSAVIIKAFIKTKPICQWMIGREFNRRMKVRFDELGIEIPFPHVTLYMGQDKQGGSPPVNVHVSERALKKPTQSVEVAG
jgi:moderate conductance mechanosensitive channel